jgi:uncharacterized tellurite resistance protein B-like protein
MNESLRAELVREIQDFLESQWPPVADGAAPITDRRLQLAAAVLMVCVVRADHESRQDEHRALELARGCSTGQKHRLVEALWRIAFADAELAGHEEYLVRKIAVQLGLSTADLVETKVRAREGFLREGF